MTQRLPPKDVVIVGLGWTGSIVANELASRSPACSLQPVTPTPDAGVWPMTFAIAMGVSRSEPALRDQINAILRKEHGNIDAILNRYHVPRVQATPQLSAR